MSLYRRKDSPCWWVDIRCPDGRRIQSSTGTSDKRRAQEYHDRLKTQTQTQTQAWDQARLGFKPRRSWREAVVRWVQEKQEKATLKDDQGHLRWLDPYLGSKMLDEIDIDLIAEITRIRREPYEIPRLKGPVRRIKPSAATVNRTLEVVRAILRKARDEWQWLDRCPPVPMLPEAARRVKWVTRAQAEALVSALPAHQEPMVRFALETGLRRGNVTHLEWSQVDLDRRVAWIHPDQAKAGKAIPVPLSDVATEVLRGQVGKHTQWVFPYRGKPVYQVTTRAWRTAVASIGLPRGFRFHDLRHTWASWHAQDGTPLHILQELGGWASAEMVQRYAHLATEHLHHYVDRRAGLASVGKKAPVSAENGDENPTEKEKATGKVA
jgi:integrase